MDDVYVYLIKMPSVVKEMVTPCQGGYTVYINDALWKDEQEEAFKHAIRHIENNDFERYDVQNIEMEAHAG